MRHLLLALFTGALLTTPRPAPALDFMTMPTADLLPPGGFYAGYYYIDIPDVSGGPTRLNLYQSAFGFANNVEMSYLTLRPDQGSSLKAFNISYQMEPETEETWATTVGVYNVFSNDYLRGSKPSYFVAGSKTVVLSQEPGGRGPVYRALIGYGTKSHRRWFYGLHSVLDPQLSAIAAQYAGQSIYSLSYALQTKEGSPIVHAGTFAGDPFYGISITRGY